MNGENRTEKNIRKRKRRKKRYILRIFLIIVVCIGIHCLLHIDHFTVDEIIVAGNKEVKDSEIQKLSELKKGENIFDIRPSAAERKIKKNLYVLDVDVRRQFPNKVEIVVSEQSGKAQFAMKKEFVITDNDGRVLEIAGEARKVTLIEGIEVEDAKPDKIIEVKQNSTYEKVMKLIKATEDGDLYFKKIIINGNDVEAYVYDKLVCKGKYSSLMECIESGALKAVVFDLYQKGKEKGVINIGSNNYCSFTP